MDVSSALARGLTPADMHSLRPMTATCGDAEVAPHMIFADGWPFSVRCRRAVCSAQSSLNLMLYAAYKIRIKIMIFLTLL
jgi:hypothetical protein